MEFKVVSAKMPMNEITLFKAFCEKKGVSPASLIRELILRELEVPVPHTVAGKNKIVYDKENDGFTWSVVLDNGEDVEVLRNVSSGFSGGAAGYDLQRAGEEGVVHRQNKEGFCACAW